MTEVSQFQLRPIVRAALIWDVPALRRRKRAANLLKAFDAPPWNLDEPERGPLDVAARGVVAATQGNVDEALAVWSALYEAPSPDVHLLGHLLRAWADVPAEVAVQALRSAADLAGQIAAAEDRARILRKIATLAHDRGDSDTAVTCVHAALAAVRRGSALQGVLLRFRWGLERGELPGPTLPWDSDPLLLLAWIRTRALDATIEAEVNRFSDDLLGTWAQRVRGGQTPLDVLNACQLQAAWAADLGLRDGLLKVMSAQLLSGAAQSDAQTRWAASAWVLASREQIIDVLHRAEGAIDPETAQELLDLVTNSPATRHRLRDVAAVVWDLLDDDGVDRLLARVDPGPLDDVDRHQERIVWANVVWRSRATWFAHWEKLDRERQWAALTEVAPQLVGELSEAEREQLLAACAELPAERRRSLAVIGAALATAQGQPAGPWIAAATPTQLVDLRDWQSDAVPDPVIAETVTKLLTLVEGERERAQEGSFGIGGADSRRILGRLSAELSQRNPRVASLLTAIANDERMPAEHQLGALEGLLAIRRAHGLETDTRAELRTVSALAGPHLWGTIDTTVLRVLRLAVLADDLSSEEVLEVAAACRAPKREVRVVAIIATADALAATPRTSLAWGLLATLYDPADDIVERGLIAVTNGALDHTADVGEVAVAALVSAFRLGRKSVRRWAVRAASRLARYPAAELLIRSATEDSSWLVRRAAADSISDLDNQGPIGKAGTDSSHGASS